MNRFRGVLSLSSYFHYLSETRKTCEAKLQLSNEKVSVIKELGTKCKKKLSLFAMVLLVLTVEQL